MPKTTDKDRLLAKLADEYDRAEAAALAATKLYEWPSLYLHRAKARELSELIEEIEREQE